MAAAGEALCTRLEDLPRPWIAVLLGGDSGQFVFTADKGRRLAQLCNKLADATGGSLLLTDSPRTPRAAGDALQSALSATHIYHRWSDSGDNPYSGLLDQADGFVVTGESMSMLAEAAAMAKPLYIFDMGDGDTPWWQLPHAYRYKPLSHRLAMCCGPARMRRDVGKIQDALVQRDAAQWLAEDTLADSGLSLRQGSAVAIGENVVAVQELRQTAALLRQLVISR